MMCLSDEGKTFIKGFEACRLVAYQDGGGVWTIGWGRTEGVREGDTCTQQQADEWFDEEIAVKEAAVDDMLRVLVKQNEFDALGSLGYNIGTEALRKSTLVRKLNASDYEGAANEFLRWDHDNGKRVAGLTRRRQEERKLFLGVA